MTQHFSLYEDLTVAGNLDFTARIRGLDRRRERVDDALDQLGLAERRAQLAGTLSGGWKQRLALAVATLHEPQLLLLDEPTAGVDPQARRTFWDEIHALAASGLTVLVSTHYMDEAERCHDIAYIAYGELIARGTADDMIARRQARHLARRRPRRRPALARIAEGPGGGNGRALRPRPACQRQRREGAGAALAPYRKPPFKWTRTEPTLEDVFIHLMGGVEDNFR